MFEVNILPDMMNLALQILSTVIIFTVMGISLYVTILIIKVLKTYINKNS